ncbi:ascorbate peroxidase Hydra magnipapillata [Seminavis robusta]|uniref:Ascorbate peroxidase Hydra magnipapillata n=1 Tax=Seminavis robusta TaxID=568900 RepID=A0A9N8E0Z7_9STRA|nr:ascorbate peroxidase Hydra magnipapillata [Seminavis robusta]|eukprot:Sro539_g162740.1 ascorbate peroxidase Hydra magnipapillata (187) ;mRNA; f:5237-5797
MGGVDALINQDDSEHNGLAETVNELDTLWNDNQSGTLSSFANKADFVAWAYIAAFYYTVSPEHDLPWVPLRTGRNTYTSGRTEDIPPNSGFGSGDHAAVTDYFATNFGMTERQFAILLGAHTLGGADVDNSGYVGDWTASEDRFNTAFYNDMQDPPGDNNGWEQVTCLCYWQETVEDWMHKQCWYG